MPSISNSILSHYIVVGATLLVASLGWNRALSDSCSVTPIANLESGEAGFTELDSGSLGIQFVNRLDEEPSLTQIVLNSGSGVAAGDVNGDGLCDLYFCGLSSDNRLYLNQGQWRFVRASSDQEVSCPGQFSTGAVLVDLDRDDDLDLLVSGTGVGVRMFLNDGLGHFTEQPDRGLLQRYGAMSMTLADIDADGDLDLYVANYRTDTIQDKPIDKYRVVGTANGAVQVASINGRSNLSEDERNRFQRTVTGAVLESGEPDLLYLNDGKAYFKRRKMNAGHFSLSDGSPLPNSFRDWGLSAVFRDLNGDFIPDLYVCNDSHSLDRLWWGEGHGQFRLAATDHLPFMSLSSMGIDVADFNKDGIDDFFVLDMLSRTHERRLRQEELSSADLATAVPAQYPRNMLFVGMGEGRFSEVARFAGVEAADWAWAPAFLDVDFDGDEDLIASNGFIRDVRDIDANQRIGYERSRRPNSVETLKKVRKLYPSWATANVAWRNQGGMKFEDVSTSWGFRSRRVSQGMALADLDNDGDMDVVFNNLNEAPTLMKNNTSAPRIRVELKGGKSNSEGIGARVEVRRDQGSASKTWVCGGRYLSSDQLVWGFPAQPEGNRLAVRWPSGAVQKIDGIKGNSLVTITETETETDGEPVFARPEEPLVSLEFQRLDGRARSASKPSTASSASLLPLLGPPARFAELLPVQSDQAVESAFLIGPSQSTPARLLRIGAGSPRMSLAPSLNTLSGFAGVAVESNEDSTVVFGVAARRGKAFLTRHNLVEGSVKDVDELPTVETGSFLCSGDLDGDGDSDLFCGGGWRSGQYPIGEGSRVYRREGETFRLASDWNLSGLRGVTSAVIIDLDGDGRNELVVSRCPGTIRVFSFKEEKWNETTKAYGFDRYFGFWRTLLPADLNGDGRLDLVAGNIGTNHELARRFDHPSLRLYYGDYEGDGRVDYLPARFERGLGAFVPYDIGGVLFTRIPALMASVGSARRFASLPLESLVAKASVPFSFLEINWLETTLFLNTGKGFKPVRLPAMAQFGPVAATAVADFDGDGREDIAVSFNRTSEVPEESPFLIPSGVLLLADGIESFRPVSFERLGLTHGKDLVRLLPWKTKAERGIDLLVLDSDGNPGLLKSRVLDRRAGE